MSKFGNVTITRKEPAPSSAGSKKPHTPPKKCLRLRFDEDGEICSIVSVRDGTPESGAIGTGWTFDDVVANGKYDPMKMVESGLKLVAFGLNEVQELKALAFKDPAILPAIAKRGALSTEHARLIALMHRLKPATVSIAHWIGVVEDKKLTYDELAAAFLGEDAAAGGREEPATASV